MKNKKVSFGWVLALVIIGLIVLPCSYAWSLEIEYLYKHYILKESSHHYNKSIIYRLANAILLTVIGITVIYVFWRYTNFFYVYGPNPSP